MIATQDIPLESHCASCPGRVHLFAACVPPPPFSPVACKLPSLNATDASHATSSLHATCSLRCVHSVHACVAGSCPEGCRRALLVVAPGSRDTVPAD
eukprot:gene23813-biopygen1294